MSVDFTIDTVDDSLPETDEFPLHKGITQGYAVYLASSEGFRDDSAPSADFSHHSGNPCGTSVLLLKARGEEGLPARASIDRLMSRATEIEFSNGEATCRPRTSEATLFTPDCPPPKELVHTLIDTVGEASRIVETPSVPFSQIAAATSERFQATSEEGIRVPLGITGSSRKQWLSLGQGTAQHALVGGTSRDDEFNLPSQGALG